MRALVIACLSMTWTACGPAVAATAAHTGGSSRRPVTARADTSEFPDDPIAETEGDPTAQPPARIRHEEDDPEPIDAFLDPGLLADAEVQQREHEARLTAELAAREAAREEQHGARREAQARATAQQEALRLAVLEHVVGRTWLCTEPDWASVLVRIERRQARRAIEAATIDAGWTLLNVRMFYGDAETGLLPGVEERFVQTLDADSIMRVDENGARVVFADWGAFFVREVTTRSFTLVGAVTPRPGLDLRIRSCVPAPGRRGRR